MKSIKEHFKGLSCFTRQASQDRSQRQFVHPNVWEKCPIEPGISGVRIEIGTTGGNITTADIPYTTMAQWLLAAVETQPKAAKQLQDGLTRKLSKTNDTNPSKKGAD